MHARDQHGGRQAPSLITSATTTRAAEIKARQSRYLITMAVRLVCFVLAATLFGGVARFIAIGLAVVLPWFAVMIANTPLALRKGTPALFTPPTGRSQSALPPARGPVVVDADPPDRPPVPISRAPGDAAAR